MNNPARNPIDSVPATSSASIAFGTLLGACFIGLSGPIQTVALVLESIGLILFIGGVLLRRRNHIIVGRILTAVGVIAAVSVLVSIVALYPSLPILLISLSCTVGVLIFTLGVFPVYAKVAYPFAVTGVSFVFISMVANTVIDPPPFWRSAVAVSCVLLTWGIADRAITLGRQVGGTAETISAEVTGISVDIAVTVTAILLTIGASLIPLSSPSFVGLALFLLALLAFILALCHVPQMYSPQVRQER